jgi:hypothetical protein
VFAHDSQQLRRRGFCSASKALAEEPSASSAVAITGWQATLARRVNCLLERAEKYRLRFTPTTFILRLTAKHKFGRKGLHPDLFITYSFDNANDLSKATTNEKFTAKEIAAD